MSELSFKATPYPQRTEWDERSLLDRIWDRTETLSRRLVEGSALRQRAFVRKVLRAQGQLAAMAPHAQMCALNDLRLAMRRDGMRDDLLVKAFAFVRLRAESLLGVSHYPVQIRGGYLIARGYLVEMDTGEGKTLTATLAAAAAALAGYRVQIVTVNDYLVLRDCEQMRPLFASLGLSCGAVLEEDDALARRHGYEHDIAYCTGKTLTFDYLKDRIAIRDRIDPLKMLFDRFTGRWQQKVLLPGLQFVIVDEADSILIDEARTPLIISATGDGAAEEAFHRVAMALAQVLESGDDFVRDEQARAYDLTERGRVQLDKAAEFHGALWRNRYRREEAVLLALTALYDFDRDVHYIVRDRKIMIVDEHTGRVMPDRAWERGLHQLIEIKEGLPVTPPRLTLAKISFQLFFRRFLKIGGMSGTLSEVSRELGSVYKVAVVRVPTHRKSRRRKLTGKVFVSSDARWEAVVACVVKLQLCGQPVLIGVHSIRAAEELSERLLACGVAHQALHAKQDVSEAEIVAEAGRPGRVTIATNMAGRGTDIKLGDGVADLGGLHVILTELHESKRIDRQLIGRCARQGQPGSWQYMLSLEDQLLTGFAVHTTQALSSLLALFPHSRPVTALAYWHHRRAQLRFERRFKRLRYRLLDAEFRLRRSLSFSGKVE